MLFCFISAASKKESKKDAKKDSKVDKKAGEKLPEEVPSDDKAKEAPEKEYKKNMDCLYYIYDVPKSEVSGSPAPSRREVQLGV